MNDNPKDKTTKWMNIIAIILVLINAFGNLICGIVAGEDGIGARFLYLLLVFLIIALRWKAFTGICFFIFGLIVIIFVGTDIITGEYEMHRNGIFSLLWYGLIPLVAGLLFLEVWRRTRKPMSS